MILIISIFNIYRKKCGDDDDDDDDDGTSTHQLPCSETNLGIDKPGKETVCYVPN
jgi:hypothetical protein